MDSRKVLYFIDLLKRETNGHEDIIIELYKRALDENDDIIRLKNLLGDYNYYREIGNAMYANGKAMLKQVYTTPDRALEMIPQIRQSYESIENAARVCDELMRSPMPFSETIAVLKKKDTIAYMGALQMIASVSVYLIALYSGLDPIKYLTWNDAVGIHEMINAVNTKFLPTLCEVERPSYSWVIRRKKLGGRALFGGDYYFLDYEDTKSVEVLCSALHKEKIGTHAFLNVDAYESEECEVPFCWGVGNILSVSPDNALQFLQHDVLTKMRSPDYLELKRKMPTPFECVRQLADGTPFCVTPDDLLLAMNQWQVGHEIEERKQTHNCLFCGKHVGGDRLVCPSHFTTEM